MEREGERGSKQRTDPPPLLQLTHSQDQGLIHSWCGAPLTSLLLKVTLSAPSSPCWLNFSTSFVGGRSGLCRLSPSILFSEIKDQKNVQCCQSCLIITTAHFKSHKKKKMETYLKVIWDLILGKLAYLQMSQPILIFFFIQQIFIGYLNAPGASLSA